MRTFHHSISAYSVLNSTGKVKEICHTDCKTEPKLQFQNVDLNLSRDFFKEKINAIVRIRNH